MYTDQDEKTIISGQKRDIEALTQKLNLVYGEESNRQRAMTHVRVAMDEAVAMAMRYASTPVVDGDKAGMKRRAEANRLAGYFRESKQAFENTLAGSIVEPVERPQIANTGTDVS